MGGLFSSKTKTTSTEKSDTGPSAFQKPYLDQTFRAARDIYNQTKDTPYYEGETYAGMDPEQKAILDRLSAYAGGTGMDTAQRISSLGNDMISGSSGKALSNLDRFTSMAGEDATGANVSAAQRYADNPYVDGMIDANSRDINRNLYERELPGIDRAASGSGNINSSRAGVASGIAQRGAADRIGDISAAIRGDAYSQGLTLAQRDRQTTMDAYGRAAEGYSDLTSQGVGAVTAGSNMAYDAMGRQVEAGAIDQADRQAQLDAEFKKWAGNDERKMDLLARYQAIVGGNQWGQSGTASGTGTSKESGNILGKLTAAASAAASMATASDRRLKNRIRHAHTSSSTGIRYYTFYYDQDNDLNLPTGQQFGVMADEIARIRPEALGPLIAGAYASVDYSAL